MYHAVKLALAQPGTGERLFTFEADKEEEKAENSKKDADIIKNDVKNNNFTGPVSYTHLDVYKRQDRHGAGQGAGWSDCEGTGRGLWPQ